MTRSPRSAGADGSPCIPTCAARFKRLLRGKRALGSRHSFGPRRPLAADQRGQLVRGAVQRSSASKAVRRIPAGAPSSPAPPATSTAPAAACATCNCSPGTDPSRRPSATSTATRAGRGGWSACCERRPSPALTSRPKGRGHASLRTLDSSPLSRQRVEIEPLRASLHPPTGTSSPGSRATRACWACLTSLPERARSRRRAAIEAPIAFGELEGMARRGDRHGPRAAA